MLVSTTLLADDPTFAFAGLAVGAAVAAAHSPAVPLMLHASIYTLAAAVASAVLPAATVRLIGSTAGWPPITVSMVGAVLGAGITVLVARRAAATVAVRIERFAVLVLFVWGAAGWLVNVLAVATASRPDGFDAGIVATLRSVVLASIAVLTAAAARMGEEREVA